VATIPFSGSWLARGSHQTIWSALGDADEGAPQSASPLPDKSVQFSGTWDSATAVLQGSNDGATWFTLKDPGGNAISLTADGLRQILENTRYIRPSTSGGGGSADIDCRVIERGGF
jgi:hypothetical protein